MRLSPLFLLLAFAFALPTAAQGPAEVSVERERITAERSRLEAEFEATKRGCYARFAVNDCIDAAQARRREGLADLRRQEIQLNDMERRRRAADHLRELEQRQAERQERERSDSQAQRQAEQQQRDARAAEKAAKSATPPQPPSQRQPKAPKAPDVEGNAGQHAERLREAEERRKKVQERAASRAKRSEPLPVPAQ